MPARTLVVFLFISLSAPISHVVAQRGPTVWVARKGEARVYIMGFGESRDTSWLTPAVRQAFDASTSLWLEVAGPTSPATRQDSAAERAATQRMERLGRATGRDLFEVLEPNVRKRTLDYLRELDIPPDSVRGLRPWRAYYVLIPAFYRNRKQAYDAVPVDRTLERMARDAGKTLGYEFPTREASVTSIARMSDAAQSQYLGWLLSFFDDTKGGLQDDEFGWIERRSYPTRSLDRMRASPDLYRAMQIERNSWWAKKIADLLDNNSTAFVAVGQLHVMGPDSIIRQLARLGVSVDSLP